MALILVSLTLLGGTLGLTGGCATVQTRYEQRGWTKLANTKFNAVSGTHNSLVLEKENDLYVAKREHLANWDWGTSVFIKDVRRITHTPDVKETEVRYHGEGGYITYFANDGDGGHWYMQPLSGDDSNRQEISVSDMMEIED